MKPKARLATVRWTIFGVVAISYLLTFFHRLAPVAISDDLTESFGIGDVALGSLVAAYFYVQTVMQIPTGVLADTLGPRRILTLGAAVTGAGCILFAAAPHWHVAMIGRLLVGLGTSVTFIAFLKLNALWFEESRFSSIGGLTIMIGNFGAVFGGTPLAWVVAHQGWREVFVGLGVLSLVLVPLTWIVVGDRPAKFGFYVHANPMMPPVASIEPGQRNWIDGLKEVARNRRTWPGFWINLGIGGTFFCFSGLWAMPYLVDVYGYSKMVAANHTTLLLLGVALGALCIGRISDRLRNRKTVMFVFAGIYLCTWMPLMVASRLPLSATYALFFVMGFVIPSYTLTWAAAKEANNPTFSGVATGVVSVGCFLGAGILQPLIGWILDVARAEGNVLLGYQESLLVLFGFSAFGLFAILFLQETYGRNQWIISEEPVSSSQPMNNGEVCDVVRVH